MLQQQQGALGRLLGGGGGVDAKSAMGVAPWATRASGKSTAQRRASKHSLAPLAAPPSDDTGTTSRDDRSWALKPRAPMSVRAEAALPPLRTQTRKGVGVRLMAFIGTGACACMYRREARAAPATRASSFIHARSAVMAVDLAVDAKPQSVPAMTRLGCPAALT